MKPAGNGNKKRKNQWKKRRWQWKEACTLSWTRHSQKGGPTSSLTLPWDLGWGVQPPGWPTPGPGWGDLGGGGVKSRFFFLLFPRKKTKKEKKTKTKKKRFGRTPPSRRGGPPKFPATFTTFPDGAAKSAKFPPNLAKVHVPRRLVTIRGIFFHLQAPKVGWHSQRKRLQVFFGCFFPFFFPFFIAFLFVFFVFCLFFFVCFCFFQNG